MLAQASSDVGRGRAFALHEALDQTGALVGPLVVAAAVALSGFRLGFAVLAVPGLADTLCTGVAAPRGAWCPLTTSLTAGRLRPDP